MRRQRSAGRTGRRRQARFRRNPHLVSYWHGDEFILHNYLSDTRVSAEPSVAQLLHHLANWRHVDDLAGALPADARAGLLQTLEHLTEHGLLEREFRTPSRQVDGLWEWWSPAAALLHFSTKGDFAAKVDLEVAQKAQVERVGGMPPPSFVKRLRNAKHVALGAPLFESPLASVLEERRTWRRFSGRGLSRESLSTLLWWTFGIQAWAGVEGAPLTPRRTSPSAGARQPLEAYVLVRKVAGLKTGLYHYAADEHLLEVIRQPAPRGGLERYIPNQWWYASAPVVVFMSAVFTRVQWRYQFPRAYRSVLLEAGHFCQTFCLVATALGLAPFCTQATADDIVEQDLGIDGVRESIVYAAGVGHRPADGECRWPDHEPGHPYRPAKRPKQ